MNRPRIKTKVCIASSTLERIDSEILLLNKKKKKQELVTRFKEIYNNIDEWTNSLFFFLKPYGITLKKCIRVAKHRAYYRKQISLHLSCDFGRIFPTLENVNQAASIYNAFIRHEFTLYDEICECFTRRINDREERYSIWHVTNPEDYK